METILNSNAHKIIFTGGGSAGHVTPNIALINECRNHGWDVNYIGSKHGMEKELIATLAIPYFAITTGKLRRYFSWRNFIDPFKILRGIWQAFWLCRKISPLIVFSKGGFVAFPVVIAAWLNRIPVIVHESDLTPGLANKLSFPFADQICVTFAVTKEHIMQQDKVVVTGTPIRPELFHGDAANGLRLCGFTADKPVILIYCGGLGSQAINRNIRALLPQLLNNFQVIHICGKNNIDPKLEQPGYKQFVYLQQELPDIMACTDLVISRSGANSLYELLTLQKPHILIPLPKKASRGDQIVNAQYFAKQGMSQVIFEETLTPAKLYEKIVWLYEHKQETLDKLASYKKTNSVAIIYDILATYIE